MNSTSPSSRLVSKPARSPAFSMVGPLVHLRFDPHALGDDVGQGGLAQARRAAEKQMVQGFAALLGGLHRDFQPLLDIRLPGELGKKRRAQRHLQRRVRLCQHVRNHSLRHAARMGKAAGSDKGKLETAGAAVR